MENGEAVIHFIMSFTPVICLIWEKKYVARIVLESIFDLRLVNFFKFRVGKFNGIAFTLTELTLPTDLSYTAWFKWRLLLRLLI